MFKLYDRGRLKFKRMKNIYIIQILLFLKKSKSGYINTRQSRLQNKENYSRQRGKLCNEKDQSTRKT